MCTRTNERTNERLAGYSIGPSRDWFCSGASLLLLLAPSSSACDKRRHVSPTCNNPQHRYTTTTTTATHHQLLCNKNRIMKQNKTYTERFVQLRGICRRRCWRSTTPTFATTMRVLRKVLKGVTSEKHSIVLKPMVLSFLPSFLHFLSHSARS
jgi:hypothetical protein